MEWEIIIIAILLIIGGNFIFKYYSLCHAIKKAGQECNGLKDDIAQNQMLHLPLPNKQLAYLLSSFNLLLEEIQLERQKYNKREKEFQKQIENISHDLRTPLTVILGYMKLINKDSIADEQMLEAVEIVSQRAGVMNKLLTEFYDYSRLNAGSYSLQLKRVDVVKVLREALMGNHQILDKSQLQLEIDLPQEPIWVLSDVVALERIFANLFQNVSRYAKSYLKIELYKKQKELSVLFINDTIILKREEVHHLFDRFYMQDNSRNQGGTGLGLTIAKSLANEMEADLTAYLVEPTVDQLDDTMQICFDLSIKFF